MSETKNFSRKQYIPVFVLFLGIWLDVCAWAQVKVLGMNAPQHMQGFVIHVIALKTGPRMRPSAS